MKNFRSRIYCFTINNPDLDKKYEENNLGFKYKYILFSLEKGEKTGNLHFQGYVQFENGKTLSAVKKIDFFKRAHLEVARASLVKNKDYILKQNPDVYYEFGTPIKQGKRNDIDDLKALIMGTDINYDEILLDYTHLVYKYEKLIRQLLSLRTKKKARSYYKNYKKETPKKVMVLWGEPGSGKTKYVYEKHEIDDIYKLQIGDGSPNSLWFDDYNQEKILLLDDFYGSVKYSYMLRLLDIYPLRVQRKGGFENIYFTHIYITSNKPPEDWYPNITDNSALLRRITDIIEVGDSITPNFCAEVQNIPLIYNFEE